MPISVTYPPNLPVSARRDEIMEAIRDNQVVVVAGETGSGKTTQIPKMLLDMGLGERGLIGHTQPRRLAARSVAERIATELGTKLGDVVGYQVRFTADVSKATRIKLMTDGILLAEIADDPLLKRYSAIIIDEAHERSLNIDFLLGYLARILPERPDLKLVITSATIDTARFAEHFARAADGERAERVPAPIIEVSGRTYPVEIRYRPLALPRDLDTDNPDQDPLEEERDPTDAIEDAIRELAKEAPGDILIFLSGEREIRDTADAVRALIERDRALAHTEVLSLYGRLSLSEQQRVFGSRPPGIRRRIVLATNVAETSLTVPGIKYVIDPGTARISRYSHRTKVQRLPIERVSQASANQRSGRAGRTSDGIAIRLYSEEDFTSRREFTEPEILRTSLASVILNMMAMGIARTPADIADFPFIEPPDAKAVNDGVTLLRELGALATARNNAAQKNDGDARQGAGASRAGGRQGGSAPSRRGKRAPGLSAVGQKMAALPLDPRLARMMVEAGRRDVVKEVMVLAAALTIQDPRELPSPERPKDRARAQELHKRFADEKSDFSSYLLLYRYLEEKQKELSGNQFRKLCQREFINYLRVREWQDLIAQLRQLAKPIGVTVKPGPIDPAGREDAIHQSLLSGLLSNIGSFDQRTREYLGARGTRFAIFPGSGLFKKNPEWVMAAELVETSRLWARTVAVFKPEWAEEIAPHLVKRSISEPHWSSKMGAAMAYEKVTLFGVPIISQRRIQFSRVDPVAARELFIQHALVEGDWRTHHRFFHRNRKRVAEVEELQTRMRRNDLMVDDATLFDFYDQRIGKEVTSERHFDKWWKHARHLTPDLLDFDPELLLSERAEDLDEESFPTTWHVGDMDLSLDYEFSADRMNPADSDGVTVKVPILFLNQLNPAPFRWQIPGFREELVTALIRSLPKSVRKNVVPAPEVARLVLPILAQDFTEYVDDFETSLELALRRLRGHVIPAGSWNWEQVPVHLKPHFRVVDERGKTLGEGQDLARLQEELTPALRRAIAESVGATPKTRPSGARNATASRGAPGGDTPSSIRPGNQGTPGLERTGLTSWPEPDLPREVSRQVQGRTVRGYPALVDAGESVNVRIFDSADAQAQFMRRGVMRLLALSVPSPARYVSEHLSNTEKLVFTQNPHGSVDALIADSTLAAIDSLLPETLPYTRAEFDAVRENVRAELVDRTFAVVSLVARILGLAVQVQKALDESPAPVLESAYQDMRSQLGLLVKPGFVAATGYAQLAQLPRYLEAMARRLDKLPTGYVRDGESMRVVQELEDEYDDAIASLRAGALIPSALRAVRWMLEELRVSFFAQELGTAYTVSAKRVRAALHKALR